MGLDLRGIANADAASALDWWLTAGVDSLVEEQPRDWLKPVPAQPAAAPEPSAPASGIPADLAAFRAWLTTPDRSLPGARVPPAGDPASGLMILADMPEAGDAAAGVLIGEAPGALLDRMLKAIERDRTAIYLASVSPVHFPAGRIPGDALTALTPAARRHVALARPAMLLLLGDAPAIALLGMPMAKARGRLHKINLDGVTVTAVASFHPRFLLQRPAFKAEAWADLRMMIGEMSQ